MQYRDFGRTGIKMSALGFGAMRLPHEEKDGVSRINTEESIRIIHRSFELGVNYIDTAFGYGESEIVVGKALRKWKKRIYLSTKVPVWNMEKRKEFRQKLGILRSVENRPLGTVTRTALEEYMARFEKEHGKIILPGESVSPKQDDNEN